MRVKLGELTKIKTGKLDANASSEDGQYPFFTCAKEPLKISTYSYDCECVLVAGNGDLNVKYYNGKFDAYQRTYIIEDNGSGKLFIPYLYFFMDGYVEELRNQSIGGVIKYIKLGNLTDAKIELPCIETQKAIVNTLSNVKRIIEARQQELQKLDDLIKAQFVEMFVGKGYPEKTVHDVLDTGFWLMPATPKYVENGIIPYITSKNIKNRQIDFENVKYITEEAFESISANRPTRVGDILISMIGTLGQTAVITDNRKFYGQNLYLLRLNKQVINTDYFCEFFNMDEVQHILQDKCNQSTQAYLKANHVEDLILPLPPMEEQEQFATFVKQLDKSKSVVQKALDEAQLLFDSLMQKYFGQFVKGSEA